MGGLVLYEKDRWEHFFPHKRIVQMIKNEIYVAECKIGEHRWKAYVCSSYYFKTFMGLKIFKEWEGKKKKENVAFVVHFQRTCLAFMILKELWKKCLNGLSFELSISIVFP